MPDLNELFATSQLSINPDELILNGVLASENAYMFPIREDSKLSLPSCIKRFYAAYRGCADLKCVELPEGLIEIGDSAFSCCKNLESVVIPSTVSVIGEHAFSSCCSLKSITLSNSLERIDAWAFACCSQLECARISNVDTEIHDEAFAECPNLVIEAPENSCAFQFAKTHNIATRTFRA